MLKKKLQKFGTGYFARGQIREPHKKIAEVWHGVFRTGTNSGTSLGTCGRVAADKSDNVWHWHQACEWAMLKKKLQKFGKGYFARGQIREPQKKIAEVWHGVFRTGTNSGTSKKNCRSLARGISHGDKFGNLKKKLQKFGTGYFA